MKIIIVFVVFTLCVSPNFAQEGGRKIYYVSWNTRFSRPLSWQEFIRLEYAESQVVACVPMLRYIKSLIKDLKLKQIDSGSSGNIDQRFVLIDGDDVIEIGPHEVKYDGKCFSTNCTILTLLLPLLSDEYALELKHVIDDFYCSE